MDIFVLRRRLNLGPSWLDFSKKSLEKTYFRCFHTLVFLIYVVLLPGIPGIALLI